jgi:hypothetical protein
MDTGSTRAGVLLPASLPPPALTASQSLSAQTERVPGTGEGTTRVHLVRGKGRDVST